MGIPFVAGQLDKVGTSAILNPRSFKRDEDQLLLKDLFGLTDSQDFHKISFHIPSFIHNLILAIHRSSNTLNAEVPLLENFSLV